MKIIDDEPRPLVTFLTVALTVMVAVRIGIKIIFGW